MSKYEIRMRRRELRTMRQKYLHAIDNGETFEEVKKLYKKYKEFSVEIDQQIRQHFTAIGLL
jgi:hypothetical protein